MDELAERLDYLNIFEIRTLLRAFRFYYITDSMNF